MSIFQRDERGINDLELEKPLTEMRICPFRMMYTPDAVTTPIDEHNMHTETGAINGGMIKRDRDLKNPVITIGVPSIRTAAETKQTPDRGGAE
jgi:hypothetical protein